MLSALPSKWSEQIASVLCQYITDRQEVSCDKVHECETVTTLSDFTVNGSEVSIVYKDEKGVQYTRSFDLGTVVNNSLSDIDPKCISTEEEWLNMSFSEKIEAIISSHCDCCGE